MGGRGSDVQLSGNVAQTHRTEGLQHQGEPERRVDGLQCVRRPVVHDRNCNDSVSCMRKMLALIIGFAS